MPPSLRYFLSPLTALVFLPAPAEAVASPTVVIDMHTHVFNAHDLPIGGIMLAQGIPLSILTPVVVFIAAGTDDYVPGVSTRQYEPRDLEQPLQIAEADKAAIRSFLGQASLRSLPSTPTTRALDDGRRIDEESLALAAMVFDAANIPPSESEAHGGQARTISPGNALAFVSLMRRSQLAIAQQLQSDYPGVSLFIHHQMDLGLTYDQTPVTPFSEQMLRADSLETEPALVGRLLHFTAFDPFRADKALDEIREPGARQLRGRALGVKFYPPSGYRPAGNLIDSRPPWWAPVTRAQWDSRYRHLGTTPTERNTKLDQINDAFFTFCADNDIPVFAHCTGFGFEAVSGYGMNCDPQYWRLVLEKHPTLRLCLAHAGGDAWWFSTGDDPDPAADPAGRQRWTFGREVVQLCLDFPNVYCEAGYLEKVLESAEDRALFLARLKTACARDTKVPGVKFGHKLMYGTDWHMIYKERDYQKYLATFEELFADPVLQPFASRFFAGTAAEYLKLPAVVNDPRFTAAQRSAIAALIHQLP